MPTLLVPVARGLRDGLDRLVVRREDELDRAHALRGRRRRAALGGALGALPRRVDRELEEVDVVVRVGRRELEALEPLLVDDGEQLVRRERRRVGRRGVGTAAAAGRRAVERAQLGRAREVELLEDLDVDRRRELAHDAHRERPRAGRRPTAARAAERELELVRLHLLEGRLVLRQQRRDRALELVHRDGDRREQPEEEVVRLGAVVARVADRLLEGVEGRRQLDLRELAERGHRVRLGWRRLAQHERPHEEALVEGWLGAFAW